MATITVRNVPDDVVKRIQARAASEGKSMEQEVRDLLEERFPSRKSVLDRMEARKKELPKTTAKEIREWVKASRERG